MKKKNIANSIVVYTLLMTLIQVTFIYISFFISIYQNMNEGNGNIIPTLIYLFSPGIASLIAIKLATIKKYFEDDKKLKKYILLSMLASYIVTLLVLGLYKTPYLAILLLIGYIPTYDIAKISIYRKMMNYKPKSKIKEYKEYNEEGNLNYELDLLNDYNISKFLRNRKVDTSNYFYALKTATISNFFIFGSYRRFRPKSYIVSFNDENLYLFEIEKKTIKDEKIIKFIEIDKLKIKNILFNKAYEIKLKLKVGGKIFLQANRKMNIIENQEKSVENLKKIIK